MLINFYDFFTFLMKFVFFGSCVILAIIVFITVFNFVTNSKGVKDWFSDALKVKILENCRPILLILLALINLSGALLLIALWQQPRWIILLCIVSYPLSGIAVTWLTRGLTIFFRGLYYRF